MSIRSYGSSSTLGNSSLNLSPVQVSYGYLYVPIICSLNLVVIFCKIKVQNKRCRHVKQQACKWMCICFLSYTRSWKGGFLSSQIEMPLFLLIMPWKMFSDKTQSINSKSMTSVYIHFYRYFRFITPYNGDPLLNIMIFFL